MIVQGREQPELRLVPYLSYDCVADRWVLTSRGYRVAVQVCSDAKGWCNYRFYVMSEGREYEALTFEQYAHRVEAIAVNDGADAAALWVTEQRQVRSISEDHPVFQLRHHWEAMIELGIFRPRVTLGAWKTEPIHEELEEKMQAAREHAAALKQAVEEVENGVPREE